MSRRKHKVESRKPLSRLALAVAAVAVIGLALLLNSLAGEQSAPPQAQPEPTQAQPAVKQQSLRPRPIQTAAQQAARAARQKRISSDAADQAAQMAVAAGEVAAGTMWYVEGLCRRVAQAGGTAQHVEEARTHGLLHFAMHLDAHGLQLARMLLTNPAEAVDDYLTLLEQLCGGDSRGAANRALRAALRERVLPRAALAGQIAECAHSQRAVASLVEGGAQASHGRGGYTLLHFMALFGDAALLADVMAQLSPAELQRQLTADSAPGQRTPLNLSLARGHSDAALVLRRSLKALGEAPHHQNGDACPSRDIGSDCYTSHTRGASDVGDASSAEESAHAIPLPLDLGTSDVEGGGWRGQTDPAPGIGAAALGQTEAEGQNEGGCDIAVVAEADLTAAQFQEQFLWPELPVLVRGGSGAELPTLRASLSRQALEGAFGEMSVSVSEVPYHDGVQPVTMKLGNFTRQVAEGHAGRNYLFMSLRPGRLRSLVERHLPSFLQATVSSEWLDGRSVQFAVGPRGSGAPVHYHKAAVNTLVYGRKQWWISPPRDAAFSNVPAADYIAADGPASAERAGRVVLRCVQWPGDVLYLPDYWGHATVNLEPSVSVASEFREGPLSAFDFLVGGRRI